MLWNRFVNVGNMIPNAEMNDLTTLRNHMSGNFDPFVFGMEWNLNCLPDNNTTIGVAIKDLLFGFSFSGRIFKSSYLDGNVWYEIPYAKYSDLDSTNTNINNLISSINTIEKTNTVKQNAFRAVPDWNFTDLLDINNPPGIYGVTPSNINTPISNAYGFLINIKNSDSSWILAIFINQEVIYTNFYNSFTSSNWTGWKNRNA